MTKEYKTLSGFMKNNDVRQFTLDMFFQGRVYDKKHMKPVRFVLGDDARKKACELFASAICSTSKARKTYADLIENYYGEAHGIFRRLWIEMRSGNPVSTYCAGQDYAAETKCIQCLLRKNS